VTVEYLDVADFNAISAAVTGLDEDTIVKVADLVGGEDIEAFGEAWARRARP
jgi:hypothetical protein